MSPRIELDGVSKRYWLGERRGALGLPGSGGRHELWSLRDVSLRVEAGETLGLIGHNGAGKTTSLRLLAGITQPTRGQVTTRGRVASLINLGAGFHRELTGRENIYLNGVILGLTRREVRQRFDEIVEFAELGPFIDTPVKQYSSGMYARLGFAVAVHVDPDVLLVDEVLSVGDVGFQDRSMRKMLSFRDRGCAVVFVSHNLSAVEMMCRRTVWLDHGAVRMEGPTPEVVRAYLDEVDQRRLAAPTSADAGGDAPFRVEEVTLHAPDGARRADFAFGEPMLVRLRCLAREPIEGLRLRVTIRGDYGRLFGAATPTEGAGASMARGVHMLECQLEDLPLLPGLYRVETSARWSGAEAPSVPQSLAAFRVTTDLESFGSASSVGLTKSRGGFLAVPYRWRLTTRDGPRDLAGLSLPSRAAEHPPDSDARALRH